MGDDEDDGSGTAEDPPEDAADDDPDIFHAGVSLSASLKCFSCGMHPRMVRTVESTRWSKLDRPRYSSWVKYRMFSSSASEHARMPEYFEMSRTLSAGQNWRLWKSKGRLDRPTILITSRRGMGHFQDRLVSVGFDW